MECPKCAAKLRELELLLSQEKVHICIISETWLEPDSALRISGYNIYRQDRFDSYGGVAVLITLPSNLKRYFLG